MQIQVCYPGEVSSIGFRLVGGFYLKSCLFGLTSYIYNCTAITITNSVVHMYIDHVRENQPELKTNKTFKSLSYYQSFI